MIEIALVLPVVLAGLCAVGALVCGLGVILWWNEGSPSRLHKHAWRYEMSGPGMERDCCDDPDCWARRYRGCGAELVEDDGKWKTSPPKWHVYAAVSSREDSSYA